jgi:Tol biopolymer transport system component/DNA-binding winged helix-turn-helix (wHTH) protein
MPGTGLSSDQIAFGPFVLDGRTGELRKGSARLRVPDQSIQVLKALIERPGELVTREELRQRLWPSDTFVDFEQGLNGIVRRLRDALGDAADAPMLIETLPRRGYRFIGIVSVPSEVVAAEAVVRTVDSPVREPVLDGHEPAATTIASSRRPSTVIPAAVLMIVIAATGALGVLVALQLHRAVRTNDGNAIPVTSYPGREVDPSVSPDGRQVVFAWDADAGDNFDIYVKQIEGDARLQLTTDQAVERRPAWSPDGQRIAFYRERPNGGGTIVIVPSLGGPEQQITDTQATSEPAFTSGLSWTPDSRGLVFLDRPKSRTSLAVFLCSIDTRQRRQLTAPGADFSDASPVISPDGSRLAFVRRFSGFNGGRVSVQPLEDLRPAGDSRALTFEDTAAGLDWTGDSRTIVFATGDGLWSIQADGGEPHLIHSGAALLVPSVARVGPRILYQRATTDANIWRIPGPDSGADSPAAHATRIVGSTRDDRSPDVSQDGRRVAYRSNRSGSTEIWRSNIDGSQALQLTHVGGGFVGSPRWSRDGEWVAFDSNVSGSFNVYVVRAEGGEIRAVTTGAANSFRPSWSGDRRWIYFGSTLSGTEQIWKVPSAGGTAIQLTKNGGFEAFEASDGKYVFYTRLRDNPGVWRVGVGGEEDTRIVDRGIESSWGVTERGVVMMDKLARPQASIDIFRFDSGAITRWVQLPARLRFDVGNPSFSVTLDGKWIVYTQLDQWGSDIEMIDWVH